jgi:hypothetical protein
VVQDRKYKTRELEIVNMLESPFTVRVLGCFATEEDKQNYLNIVMETFERNFFEMLRLNLLGSGLEMKSYAYQMLRGLH